MKQQLQIVWFLPFSSHFQGGQQSFSKNNSQGVQIRRGQGYMSRLTVFIRQAYNTKHSTEIGRKGTVPYPIICLGCLYFYTSGRCTIPNTVPQQVSEVLRLTQWLPQVVLDQNHYQQQNRRQKFLILGQFQPHNSFKNDS